VREIIVLANLVVTGYLTGLIWTIQVVPYPLFTPCSRGLVKTRSSAITRGIRRAFLMW